MRNILTEMSPSLMRYSKVTSQILQAIVSIADTKQVLIGYDGGEWHTSSDVNMVTTGHIIRASLKTRQPQVMLKRHGHPACSNCVSRDTCKECVEIWAPIVAQQHVLGTIGAVWAAPEQQQAVIQNHDTYLGFLVQMADLIAFEAMQQMQIKKNEEVIRLLEAVLDRLDSGVIVLDKSGNILQINQMGQRILSEPLARIESKKISLHPTGELMDHLAVYQLSDGRGQCTVAGNLYQIHTGPYSQVLIFNGTEQLRHGTGSAFHQITGISSSINQVRDYVKTASKSLSCVLICAESGLGKELYARAIHDESDRRDKPFVVIDCASIPAPDAEKYLFGSVTLSNLAGTRGKPGQIEAAAGGTLFLNNITALSLPIQQQLVKVLERKEIVRVGSKKPRRVNVRVIAATGPDLWERCEAGQFDRSLYYLISVLPVTIPPLRDRREDIRPLAYTFINRFAREINKTVEGVDDGFWLCVETYPWPGNVRELRNAMEYAVNMLPFSGTLSANLLPKRIQPEREACFQQQLNLEAVEKETIGRVLQLCEEQGLSREKAAGLLGIGPATLYRKIKKYGF